MRKLLFIVLAVVLGAGALPAQAAVVKTVRDPRGWKLQVDGEDLAIKGMIWSYTPAGEDFTYNLWSQPDEVITRVIDTDMSLMKAQGVNSIRVFSTVPPRWIEYIFDQYGIYTMVNDLFGRYGVEVDGKWQVPTDYSDPDTRKVLLTQAKTTFETYRNTRGVLLYMLGNESNYGLEWKSAATENLPGGERAAFKAKALYTLFEEAFALGKTIDPNHPMGLVNGDLQYLSVMKQLVPDLDLLGVNTYRGPKSYDPFYRSIETGLDRPFVYTELGADCYNVATSQEDQENQTKLIVSQWQEIYEQSYGKGKSANCLGGYVFEWMDEWWKNGPEAGLTAHATQGTWNNGAYAFDETPGKNNMNEEWFGVVGQSLKTEGGVPRRIPRESYFALKDLWRMDMYTSTNDDIVKIFTNLNLGTAQAQGLSRALGDGTTDPQPALELHGSITTRSYIRGDNLGWAGKPGTADPYSAFDSSLGTLEAFQTTEKIGATLRLSENLTGSFLFRLLPNQVANDPAVDLSDPAESATHLVGKAATNTTPSQTRTPIGPVWDLYQATVDYRSDQVTATLHYHDGHPDWAAEGDFFGLLPETYDLLNTDKAGSHAPFGLEFTLPTAVPGLKVYAGPEIYWGANPSVLAKYTRTFGSLGLTLVHDEEVGTYLNHPSNWDETGPAGIYGSSLDQRTADRWTSLDATYPVGPWGDLEAGLLLGRYDRVGNSTYSYNKIDGTTLTTGATFTLADALAGKVRITSDAVPYLHFNVQYLYAGLLAGSRSAVARDGSQLWDSGSGNRSELKAAVTGVYGDFALTTTGLFRTPLVDAITAGNPFGNQYIRNPQADSFTVWDNRKAVQGEAVITWNPTGATYFHDWNNVDREQAPLAASLGLLYNFYLGPTDPATFLTADNILYSFPQGLPSVADTWSVKARVTGRPFPGIRVNLTGQVADQQATGLTSAEVAPVIQFWKAGAQVAVDRILFEGSYASDAWGPYDWDRQFGISYPTQWSVGVAYGLKPLSFLTDTDRIGLRFSERVYGSNSDASELALYQPGSGPADTYHFEAELYAGWSF